MPVTNLKPDNEDAEDETKLLANYNTKKKFRQVCTVFKYDNITQQLKISKMKLSLSVIMKVFLII